MKRLFEMLSADRQGDDNNHVALGQDAVLRGEADRAAHGIGCGPVGSHASEGEPADASGGSYARFGAELPAVGAGTFHPDGGAGDGAGLPQAMQGPESHGRLAGASSDTGQRFEPVDHSPVPAGEAFPGGPAAEAAASQLPGELAPAVEPADVMTGPGPAPVPVGGGGFIADAMGWGAEAFGGAAGYEAVMSGSLPLDLLSSEGGDIFLFVDEFYLSVVNNTLVQETNTTLIADDGAVLEIGGDVMTISSQENFTVMPSASASMMSMPGHGGEPHGLDMPGATHIDELHLDVVNNTLVQENNVTLIADDGGVLDIGGDLTVMSVQENHVI